MNEAHMRQIVVKSLSGLDALSVENPVRPGTPDLNYIEGWLELKVLHQWPLRAATKIRVPCFTAQQRVWLRRRWERGGAAYLLILIDRDWLLYDGYTAGRYVGKDWNKNEMRLNSCMYCEGQLDKAELYGILKNGRNNLT